MRLTKDDSEVNLANGEADPEFAEWKWASPEEVIEQASCKNFCTNIYKKYDMAIIFRLIGDILITGSGLQETNL